MAAPAQSRRSGTQSIERAIQVLKEITGRSRFGWRPSDLAARCSLDRGTTHRILACLVRERLVQQRRSDRHYVPGPLLFEMGLSTPSYTMFQAECQPILARVAKRLQGYALLCVRSGTDSVCVATAGARAYVGTAFDVGTRRSLTATATGVAILIAMPPAEREAVVAKLLNEGDGQARSKQAFLRMWRKSVAAGFAVNQGYTARGVNAVGVPLNDASKYPFGSFTLAGDAVHLPAPRMTETAEILRREGLAIERLVRQAFPEGFYNAQSM